MARKYMVAHPRYVVIWIFVFLVTISHVGGKTTVVSTLASNSGNSANSDWPDCPKNFKLVRHDSPIVFFCVPQSCANVTVATENNGGSTNTTRECKRFEESFWFCSKTHLAKSEFTIDNTSGAVINLLDDTRHELGRHFTQNDNAMICDSTFNNTNFTKDQLDLDTPHWCQPFPEEEDRYSVASNGTLILLDRNNITLSPMYYFFSKTPNKDGRQQVNVCHRFSLNLGNCKKLTFTADSPDTGNKLQQKVLQNLSLWTNREGEEVTYALGNYLLSYDGYQAGVCFDKKLYRYVNTKNKTQPECPNSFALDEVGKTAIYFTCVPWSCAGVTMETENETSSIGVLIQASSTCISFTDSFRSCSKTLLHPNEYDIKNLYGDVINLRDGSKSRLGNYFIYDSKVLVCDSLGINGSKEPEVVEMPRNCLPFPVPETNYSIEQNGKLVLPLRGNITISPMYYRISKAFDKGGGVRVNVCHVLSTQFLNCDNIFYLHFEEDDFYVFRDLSMWTTSPLYYNFVYSLGDYQMAIDGNEAKACLDKTLQKSLYVAETYFQAMNIVSVVFSLLTLSIHIWLPNLNTNAKPLLCLLVSMFCRDLVKAIPLDTQTTNDKAVSYTLFTISNVMMLSTYLWLNVFSYMIWHSFSHLMENAAASRIRSQNNHRKFIGQCVYAWGIPTVVCALIMTIDSVEAWKTVLNINIQGGRLHQSGNLVDIIFIIIGIIIIANLVIYTLTVFSFCKTKKATNVLNKKAAKQRLEIIIKLFVIMDGTWIITLVLIFINYSIRGDIFGTLFYVETTIEQLQSVFLFVVYVCKKNTFKEIKIKTKWPLRRKSETASTELANNTSQL